MAAPRIRPNLNRKAEWEEIQIGPSAKIYVKTIEKQIMAKMPKSQKTFLDMGVLDLVGMKLKSLIPSAIRVRK